jgi:choline kinase
LQALLKSKADIAVTIDKEWESYWEERNENPLNDAETLKLRDDGTISEIGQKPKSLSEIEGQYMGLMKFSAEGLKQIKEIFHAAVKKGNMNKSLVEESYMTDLLQTVINSGYKVTSVPIDSAWIEVDTVKDLRNNITSKRLKEIFCE